MRAGLGLPVVTEEVLMGGGGVVRQGTVLMKQPVGDEETDTGSSQRWTS